MISSYLLHLWIERLVVIGENYIYMYKKQNATYCFIFSLNDNYIQTFWCQSAKSIKVSAGLNNTAPHKPVYKLWANKIKFMLDIRHRSIMKPKPEENGPSVGGIVWTPCSQHLVSWHHPEAEGPPPSSIQLVNQMIRHTHIGGEYKMLI